MIRNTVLVATAIEVISVQLLLLSWFCVLGKDALRHFPLFYGFNSHINSYKPNKNYQPNNNNIKKLFCFNLGGYLHFNYCAFVLKIKAIIK